MASNHEILLSSIRDQRAQNPLAILTLAEPILSETPPTQTPSNLQTNSHNDTSSNTSTAPQLNPQTLSADLQHYRDLFSKLRFSYIEQVTKEKYLRSIVGDPAILVTHDENLALEDRLVTMKAELKAKKEENEQLVKNLEALAEEIAEKYDVVNSGMAQLEVLPVEIAELERQVQEIKDALGAKERELELDGDLVSHEPRMNMSLEDTRDAVEEQRRRIREVDEQIAALQEKLPGRARECERVERELDELEGRRNEVTRLVREMRRVREEGGRDRLEEQGRWLRGEEAVLRALLGVEG